MTYEGNNPRITALINLYSSEQFPVVVLSPEIEIIWANDKALRTYPQLRIPNILKECISSESLALLMERLNVSGLGAVDFSGRKEWGCRICFQPFFKEDGKELDFLFAFFYRESPAPRHIPTTADISRIFSLGELQVRDALNGIMNHAKLLNYIAKKHDDTWDQAADSLNIIYKNSHRILRSYSNIAEYSRYMLNENVFSPDSDLLNLFLRRNCEDLVNVAKYLKIGFEYEICDEALHVPFMKIKLARAVFNFIRNSLMYSREGNKVSISLTRQGGKALIFIRDYGKGMSAEKLESVFNSLSAGTAGIKPHLGNGAGFGLPLAYFIVKEHGGEIKLDSIEGFGTVASVILPLSVGNIGGTRMNQFFHSYPSDYSSPLYLEFGDLVPSVTLNHKNRDKNS
ncbi:MAG: HAMP domain-containing histidine kinase [Oscillospiraceae bacterium]|nr:HAMP domain-containing histidine kinase [Oscillospiraceae bacterium]